MTYSFDFSFLWDTAEGYPQDLLHGVLLTIQMSLLAIVLGFVLGALCAVARTSRSAILRSLMGIYVEIIRNTPLLVQTFWLFFGLAGLGFKLTAFTAAVIALTVNVAAYTCEIIRAGIESIRKGQIEAGESLGFSRFRMLLDIVLPPAIERVLPALTSQFVLLLLGTSVMSQISAEELMAAASRTQSSTFRGFEIYIVVAVIYLVLTVLLRLLVKGIAWIAFPRRRHLSTAI